MQYFTIFQDKLHSFNIQDHRNKLGLLAKPFKKFPKSPICHFAKKFKRVTLQHDKEFIVFIDLLTKKRLSTSASDVHERLKTNGKEMKIALLRLLTINKEI